jgi:hypothetical protein
VGQQPPPWPVAGDGAPRCEVCGEVVAFERFLERAAEIHLWAPNYVGVNLFICEEYEQFVLRAQHCALCFWHAALKRTSELLYVNHINYIAH